MMGFDIVSQYFSFNECQLAVDVTGRVGLKVKGKKSTQVVSSIFSFCLFPFFQTQPIDRDGLTEKYCIVSLQARSNSKISVLSALAAIASSVS